MLRLVIVAAAQMGGKRRAEREAIADNLEELAYTFGTDKAHDDHKYTDLCEYRTAGATY